MTYEYESYLIIVNATQYSPPHSIRDCPFDISSKDLFGFVFGDKCGVVESIAFSPNNTTLAYAGTPSRSPQPQIATATCTSSTSRVTP